MIERDRQALADILMVLDRALGFLITDLQTLESTDYLEDALIQDCRDCHPSIPWQGIAGMRDLLIHAYDHGDLEEVWQAYQQFQWLRQQIALLLET